MYDSSLSYLGLVEGKECLDFRGCEKQSHDLKLLFLRTLLQCVNALGLFSCYSLLDLIDSCSYSL